MKRILMFTICCLALFSCSKKESVKLSLDDVRISGENGDDDNYTIARNMFTILPGKYEISMEPTKFIKQLYNAKIKLKFHLNTSINVSEDKINHSLMLSEFSFFLIDAEGNKLCDENGIVLPAFWVGYGYYVNDKKGEAFQRDEVNNFYTFLDSQEGTESEITIGSPFANQQIKALKKAKGLMLELGSLYLKDPDIYRGRIIYNRILDSYYPKNFTLPNDPGEDVAEEDSSDDSVE